jgi:hypothetical protein
VDAQTQAWIDQERARLTDTVRKHGWAIEYIGGDTCSRPGCECPKSEEPPFAYTIGMFGMAHPELLIVGVDPTTASGVLNDLGKRVRNGATLLPGGLITFDSWPHRIIPEDVPNAGEILLGANSYYQRPPEYSVPALQLSYDDVDGRFPWEPGCAEPQMQPRPGTFTA